MPIIEGTFAQAAAAETTSDADEREAVETLLAEYTSVVTDLASARAE